MCRYKALEESVRSALLKADLSDSEGVEDRLTRIVRNASDIYVSKKLWNSVAITAQRLHLPVIHIELLKGSEVICSWEVYLSRVDIIQNDN